MPVRPGPLTRDEKVENLVTNYPVLMMASFEGAFESLASRMGEALAEGNAALAAALTGETQGVEGSTGGRKKVSAQAGSGIGAKISGEVMKMFEDMRREIRQQMTGNGKKFRSFIRDPAFDEGVRIVEEHDFGLPKLTEALTDEELGSYLILLGKEDPEFVRMMRELSEWQDKTPKFKPEKR